MGYDDLKKRFSGKKILVLGDVMLDKYSLGPIDMSPEAPIPRVMVESEEYKAGGAGNVALNVSNLSPNSEVYLFSFIGNDIEGNYLKKFLEEKNIIHYLDSDESTILKQRIVGTYPGRPQQVFRIDREKIAEKIFSREYISKIKSLAEECDNIIISDYAKGTITVDLMDQLLPYKNKMIIDPKPKNSNFSRLYHGAYLIKPNRAEARVMTGIDPVCDAGRKLKKDLETNILMTLGKDGMILFPREGGEIKIPTKQEEEFEETGAGDTATAAITLAIAAKYSLVEAAKIANYASLVTIKRLGTYAPTIEELLSSIEKNVQ